MRNILSDLEGNILDCAKAIETFDNAILQLHVDIFERIQSQFEDFDDQLSDMADFLDDEDVSDKYGEWSREGMARAGLLTQQYELAQKQVHDYGEEINWLNKQYAEGKYSTTEYLDRLEELNSKQRDYAQQAEDAKDAILDLNKARVDIIIDGINEEIDAYSKLIQKEKDALSAERDLHEWRKQLMDSTKTITDLEKQLAAMENDNSAAANAKKKQLQQQLKEAQDNLAEQEYDHSITAQQDALDQQLEQYKEARQKEIDDWNAYLENITLVMSDTFTMVQENAFQIGETITQTAQEHGITMSEALTSAWQAGEGAIASYGETLSASTSAFIENLDGVEQKTFELQAQADATSVQLAAMFGNRADNLVSELQRSWDSEENLRNATNALNEAFVEAIDTGGRISEIVAPMESAKEATDAVASAADGAASSFDNMGSSAYKAGQQALEALEKLDKLSNYEPPYKTERYWSQMDRVAAYEASQGKINYASNWKQYSKHAKGLSKAQQDELAWTQELGDEVIVSPTRSSILTPIKKGDSVLTADMTKNLWELAKINLKDLVKGQSISGVPTIQQNKAISLNFGSAIEVKGNVNDSLAMAQIASQEAQNKISKTLKDLSDEMKY